MGHTKPPFSVQYAIERQYFSKYRRALTPTAQRYFDKMWGQSEFHLPAMIKTAYPLPIVSVLISMNIEKIKAMDELETRYRDQAARIRKLERMGNEKDIKLLSLEKQLEEIQGNIDEWIEEQWRELFDIQY